MILTPRQGRIAADIFTALVVASVGVALASLTWRLAGFAGTAAPAIVPGAAGPLAGPADVSAAVSLAPFGRATSDGAPPTALPIELRAIILTAPRERSVALIAPPGGKPLAYGPGAVVSGATIEEIAIDRVILRVNGRAESLAFPRPVPAATGAASPVIGAGPSDAPPPPAPIAAPAPGPADLAAQLGATPTGAGYRIGTPPVDAATRLGLQAGDVIASVNGVPLGDAARDRQTLAAAQAAGSGQVELVRGGRRITLSMPFR